MALPCSYCEQDIKRNEKNVLKCFICNQKCHLKCSKFTEQEYNLISDHVNIKYACRTCSTMEIFTELKGLKEILSTCVETIKNQAVMIDKNSNLLNELVRKEITNETQEKATFSEMLRKNKEVLIIKPKDEEQKNDETRKDIKSNLNPSRLAVGVENIRNIKNGGVVINCSNGNSKDILKNKAEEAMGDKYEVIEGTLTNPKIIIVGVEEEIINSENEDILQCVVEQNQEYDIKNKSTLIKKFMNRKKKNYGNIVLEVEAKNYKQILNAGKINVGWRRCNVFEYFDITRCFNCYGFNHKAKKCTNKVVCPKCSNEHKENECNADYIKCKNCVEAVKKLNVKLDVNHVASDINCPCYKKMIERECNRTKYNI